MKSADLLALSLLTAGVAAQSFGPFLPPHSTMRSWVLCAEDRLELEENIQAMRSGYRPAVMMGSAMGALVSLVSGSPVPLLAGLGAGMAMIKIYETALPPELQLQNPLDIFSLPAPGQGAGAITPLSTGTASPARHGSGL